MPRTHRTAALLALTAAAALLTACQPTRDQAKQQMTDDWLATRSALYYDMGMSQFRTGDLEQAAESASEGLKMNPQHAGLFILAGRIEMERARLDRSHSAFVKAIDILEVQIASQDGQPRGGQPQRLAEAHYYKGIVEQRWRREADAYQSYRQAFTLQPENPSYLLAQSEMLVELDRAEEAVDLLEEHRFRFGQDATIRATLAHLHAMLGRPTQSIAMFREAVTLDPTNTKLKEEFALQLLANGQTRDAIDPLEAVLADPAFAERRDLSRLLADAYVDDGDLTTARTVYAQLTRMIRPPVEDWIKAGELAWRDNDTGAALSAANRVINQDPSRYEGYTLAGLVWQKRGRVDQALTMFDRAAELAPASAEPLLLRGLTLQGAGQTSAAEQAYRDAMERNPSDPRARQLLDSLAAAG